MKISKTARLILIIIAIIYAISAILLWRSGVFPVQKQNIINKK